MESGPHGGLIKARGVYYNMIMQEELLDKIPDVSDSEDSTETQETALT